MCALRDLAQFVQFNIPPWFFTFLKLYKWYQIVQRITYRKGVRKMGYLAKSIKNGVNF